MLAISKIFFCDNTLLLHDLYTFSGCLVLTWSSYLWARLISINKFKCLLFKIKSNKTVLILKGVELTLFTKS